VTKQGRIGAFLAAAMFAAGARGSEPGAVPALPDQYVDKVEPMPDLCQTDEAFASLPYEGRYWCGPTSLANVLLVMDGRGYANLFEGDRESKRDVLSLLAELGTMRYMRTGKSGTGPVAAMQGIGEYVRDRGYDAAVEFRGWRRADAFGTGEAIDPEWLARGVLGDSNVLLNVGWYKHDRAEDRYARVGGHYMTLAGYRRDGEGLVFLIHDPAPRSGPGKVTHATRLVPIGAGRLAPWRQYPERSAVGQLRLDGVVVKSTADVALLDGAIRFELHRAGSPRIDSP